MTAHFGILDLLAVLTFAAVPLAIAVEAAVHHHHRRDDAPNHPGRCDMSLKTLYHVWEAETGSFEDFEGVKVPPDRIHVGPRVRRGAVGRGAARP